MKQTNESGIKLTAKQNHFLTDSEQFSMETVFTRFPKLNDQILKQLDDKNLVKCKQISKVWWGTIVNQRCYWIKKIQNRTKNYDQFHQEEWKKAMDKTSIEILKRFSKLVWIHSNNGKNKSVHPLTIVARFSAVSVFKEIFA